MGVFDKIWKGQGSKVDSYASFWTWFLKNEKDFHRVVKEKGNVEKEFFRKMGPMLSGIKEGIHPVTGMFDDHTVELEFTADGVIANFVFIEELVAAAPEVPGWRFTAFKPALNHQEFSIEMGGFEFSADNISFYPVTHPDYPDEIDIHIVYGAYTETESDLITNGVYIFLDNILGELQFTTTIDQLTVVGAPPAGTELIPVHKLKDYLTWREKEFVERYEGTWYHSDDDQYAIMEAMLPGNKPLVVVINKDLQQWDNKAAYPWMLVVSISYKNVMDNGMPDAASLDEVNRIEEDINAALPDKEGYLYLARETGDGKREIFFACKDFRKPSRVLTGFQSAEAANVTINYTLYKDKYWHTLDRYVVT